MALFFTEDPKEGEKVTLQHFYGNLEDMAECSKKSGLLPNFPRIPPPQVWYFSDKKITHIFLDNETLVHKTNFTLGLILKSPWILVISVYFCPK